MYVAVTANSDLPLIASSGMRVIAQHERMARRGATRRARTRSRAGSSTTRSTWQLGPGAGYAELEASSRSLPDDGRLRYNNYGKGVTFWETERRGGTVRQRLPGPRVGRHLLVHRPEHLLAVRRAARCWRAATRALTPAECRRAANYGATVDADARPRQPRGVEAGVGVRRGWPPVHGVRTRRDPAGRGPGRRLAEPDRRRARHHLLQPQLRRPEPDASTSCATPPTRRSGRAVTDTNRRIAELAPRAERADGRPPGGRRGRGPRRSFKWANGHFYVFAGSAGTASAGGSRCPASVTRAPPSSTRAARSRSPAASFTDSFADGNAIHIYRIDGGSTCGLSGTQRLQLRQAEAKPEPGLGQAGSQGARPRGAAAAEDQARAQGVEAGRRPPARCGSGSGPAARPDASCGRSADRKGIRRVRVTAKVIYTPTDGKPNRQSRNLRLKRRG